VLLKHSFHVISNQVVPRYRMRYTESEIWLLPVG